MRTSKIVAGYGKQWVKYLRLPDDTVATTMT